MSVPRGVQVTIPSSGKIGVHFLEKDVNFNLPKICSADLHTPLHRHAATTNSALETGDA